MKHLNLLLVGFIAGFASSALGIGGGVIIVPALVLLHLFHIKKAVGTSLATIAPVALVGVIAHYIIQSSNINFIVALFMIAGSIIGAKYGADLTVKIKARTLTILFALLLVFVGLKLTNIINITIETVAGSTMYPLLILLGLFAGLCSALFGIGGGAIIVPLLNLFFGLTIHEAIATSLVVILPTTIAGFIFHMKFEHLDTKATKFLVPTALIGAVLGAIFANSIDAGILKMIFGVFMIVVALKLFFEKDK